MVNQRGNKTLCSFMKQIIKNEIDQYDGPNKVRSPVDIVDIELSTQ